MKNPLLPGLPNNTIIKVVNNRYKLVQKTNKKTGEQYPAFQPVGEPCGVVVALKSPRGPVKIGWSLCNLKLDKFNKIEGVKYALKNKHDINVVREAVVQHDKPGCPLKIPHTVLLQVARMIKRADMYYDNKK